MADLSALLQQGHALFNAGQIQQAEAHLRQLAVQYPYQAEVLSDWGIALHGLGQLGEAEHAFRRALQGNPNLANVHSNLGVCLQGRGLHQEALDCQKRAIQLDPNFAAAYLNLGNVLSEMRRPEEALQAHRRAVELNPKVANGYTNLGNTLSELKRYDEALQCHQKAIQVEPSSPNAYLNLGNTLHVLNRYAEAEAAHRKSIELNPRQAAGYSNWGNSLLELNRLTEALQACLKAIQIDPKFRNAHMNAGNVYRRMSRFDEAEKHHREALRLDPDFADGYLNFGNTLYAQGKFDEAVLAFEKSMSVPANVPSALSNIGMTMTQLGRFEEAFDNYRRAIENKDDCAEARWNRSWTQLLLGQWAEAWPDFEWRFKLKQWDKKFSDKPYWEGQPLAGKTLLLTYEQGIGDTLMMLRFLPWLKEQGANLLLLTKPTLMPLLREFAGIVKLIPENEPWPPHDYFAPIMSLLVRYPATLDNVPRQPFLHARPELVESWKERLAGWDGFRVGIAWQGSPGFTSDRWRSVPLAAFAPLAQVQGVQLISLQRKVGLDQLAQVPFKVSLLSDDVDTDQGAFVDTAAILKNLDLVICSDTAIPHLAGALGVPVWMALGVIPDWRWLTDRRDSPLYPSMRLFRQTKRDRWDDVFQNIAQELKELVNVPRPRPLLVEIAAGELLDKISILEIKSERLSNPGQLVNVRRELEVLSAVCVQRLETSEELTRLAQELKKVNSELWEIEDDIRACERDKNFGPRFIALARAVYQTNDRRAALKRQANELLQSGIVEEKSYAAY